MATQEQTLRRFSTTWPPVFWCGSCSAASVNAPGVFCSTCIEKEAAVARYDMWYSEQFKRIGLWLAIVVITVIVFVITWFSSGR